MTLEAIAILIGLGVNAVTFAYFYGRLSMRVDGHESRIIRLEDAEEKRVERALAARG